MVDYYIGREFRADFRRPWTYRKSFVVIAIGGLATWAAVISVALIVT